MNVAKYLNRINYYGKIELDLKTLGNLQKHHLLNVPFENLDIHSKTKIELDTENIYRKVVINKRGGICYELNGLFNELLKEIGFETKIVSGRVYDKDKGYGKEYDHLALVVCIGEKEYLVDVGFGEFVFFPLEMKLDKIQQDERGHYYLDKYDTEYWRVNKLKGGHSIPQYIFTKKPRKYDEFLEMCNYHQTSPVSHFTKDPFLGIPIEDGRISLVGKKLKITKTDKVEEREISEEEYKELLIKYFKFELKK